MTGLSAKLGAKEGVLPEFADSSWKILYVIGSVAALVAALVFRRNLGAAEIPLFTGISPPKYCVWLVYIAS